MTEQKSVLVTGAGGGIGRACVHHFAQKGWRVVGVDRSDFGTDFPKNGRFIQADISHPELAEQIFQQARDFHPTLDALVNNAAVQVAKPLVETTVAEWDDPAWKGIPKFELALNETSPRAPRHPKVRGRLPAPLSETEGGGQAAGGRPAGRMRPAQGARQHTERPG